MADHLFFPRPIYLLGSNSYIAGQLRRHFEKHGHRVTGISHSIGFTGTFEDGAAIVNCSASYQPATDWDQMLKANYLFAKKMIERCNETNTVVNLASYFEIGEVSNPGPINKYASAKLLLRAWLTDFARTKGIQVLNLMLYDVVGPDDHRRKLIPSILKLQAGDEIELTGCEQIVNLTPVENVVEAISQALSDRTVSGLFSASNTGFKPLKDYIHILQSIIGFRPVFGAIPYGSEQIFQPLTNIPCISDSSSVEFNHNYVSSLRNGPELG